MAPTGGGEEAAGSGSLAYCRLLVLGADRATEAVVVDPGSLGACGRSGQTVVVACPAECALAHPGGCAGPAEEAVLGSYSCECAGGVPCGVVFYCIDSAALLAAPAPTCEVLRFRGSDGQPVTPGTDSLRDTFSGQAAGDATLMRTLRGQEAAAGPYDEVRFGATQELFLWNSVVVIPDFLAREECHILLEAADRCARSGSRASSFYSYQDALHRVPVRNMDLEAQMLSKCVVGDRLLGFFEEWLPAVAEELFGRRSRLAGLKVCFSPGEPAVNRYAAGGGIAPHTDKQSVTLNVLLSEPGAFTGGGTMFWPQEAPEVSGEEQEQVLLRPPQGTAIVFNGDVKHAGRPVVSGVRHTYVASFNLFSLEEG